MEIVSMNGLIEKIKADLKELNLVDNTSDLDSLFDSDSFNCAYAEKIDALNEHINTIHQIEKKIAYFGQEKITLTKLEEQLTSIQQEINDYEHKLVQHRTELTDTYSIIEKKINENMSLNDPTAPTYKITHVDGQQRNVLEYQNKLEHDIKEIEKRAAKLKLISLRKKIKTLLAQLSEVGVICSEANGMDHFKSLQFALSRERQQLEQLQSDINELNPLVATQLIQNQLCCEIEKINESLTNNRREHFLIEKKIESLALSHEEKDQLTIEYGTSPEQERLVPAGSSNKINTLVSYINPYAWHNWYKTLEFIQLIGQQEELALRNNSLTQKLTRLNIKLEKFRTNYNNNQLYEKAIELLNHPLIKDRYSPITVTQLNNALYARLLQTLPLINNLIDNKTFALNLVSELNSADQELDRFRTAHNILVENEFALTDDEQLQLTAKSPSKHIQEQSDIHDQLSLCQKFQGYYTGLSKLRSHKIELEKKQKYIRESISKVPSSSQCKENLDLLDVELKEHQNHIKSGVRELAISRKEFDTSVAVKHSSLVKTEKSSTLPIGRLKKSTPNEQHIEYWHMSIAGLLPLLPQDIQDWYKLIHEAILTIEPDSSTYYQALHLLKDILYEIQHKSEWSVLRNYKNLCSCPKEDLPILLALKPALPILPYTIYKSDAKCPPQIKVLYQHYEQLRVSHYKEAQLLLEASCILHQLFLVNQANKEKSNPGKLPRLINDPRYNQLKKHRGFLKLWEYLEHLFWLIIEKIGGKTEQEYSKKSCFFKTKSINLLEQVNQDIQNMLPTCSA